MNDRVRVNHIFTAYMRKRQRWDDYFMDLAIRSSQMSHCKRLQVGAVAVFDQHPILTGWNGTAPGEDNCCEESILVGTANGGWDTVLTTKPAVNHAERNLIEFAAKAGIKLGGSTLYITHAPCLECAKSIRNSGIIELVYKDVYRCDAGLNHLNGMTVRQYVSS